MNFERNGRPWSYLHTCYIAYGSAVLMGIFTILNFSNMYSYIHDLSDAGQLVISQQLMKVLLAYGEAVLPYVFYSFVLFALGRLLQNKTSECIEPRIVQSDEAIEVKRKEVVEEADEDIDEYLKSIS